MGTSIRPLSQMVKPSAPAVRGSEGEPEKIRTMHEILGITEEQAAASPQFSAYTEVSDDNDGVLDYVGDLFQLFGSTFGGSITRPYEERSAIPFTLTANELSMIGERMATPIKAVANYVMDPNFSIGKVADDTIEGGRDFANALGGAVTSGDIVSPTAWGGLVKGLLDTVIRSPLTLASGQTIVDGEVVGATSEEMAQAALNTASVAVAGGMYSKLSTAAQGTLGMGRTARLGTIAKNVIRQAPVEVAVGTVQAGIANPEDISFEMLAQNIANPVVLAIGVGDGLLRTRGATKAQVRDWYTSTKTINNDVTTALPSSQQLTVTVNSTLGDALVKIDALTTASDWIDAGRKAVEKDPTSTYILPDLDAADAANIKASQMGETMPVKPTVQGVRKGVKYRGVNIYFNSLFDEIVYLSDDLPQTAKDYNIPQAALESYRNKLIEAVKKTPEANPATNATGKPIWRSKLIPEIQFDAPKTRARAYYSEPTRTLMFISQPLLPTAKVVFEKTGFLPKENVLLNGTEAVVEGLNKNGSVRLRVKGGKFASAEPGKIQRVLDGNKTHWSKTAFNESYVDRFLTFADKRPGRSFANLLEDFSTQLGWDSVGQRMDFEEFFYRVMEQRERGGEGGQGPLTAESKLGRYIDELANRKEIIIGGAVEGLNASGLRIEPQGTRYAILDINGKKVAEFGTLEELVTLSQTNFASPNVTSISPNGTPPSVNGNTPAGAKILGYNKRPVSTKSQWLNKIKLSGFVSTWLRSAPRMAMDWGTSIGVPELGAQFADGMDTMFRAVDAFTQGAGKPMLKELEVVIKKTEKLSLDVRSQITKALQTMSLSEIKAMMTPDQIALAQLLDVQFRAAGGVEPVKIAFQQVRDSANRAKTLATLAPEMQTAVSTLDNAINSGLIKDSVVLRYVDALDSGQNITAKEYVDERVASGAWDKSAVEAYDAAKKLFDIGEKVFGINNPIEGYAPWIRKWDTTFKGTSLGNVWTHDLNRLGLTPAQNLISAIDDIAYRYTKTGIHYKAPLKFQGRTSGLRGRAIPDPLAGNTLTDLREFDTTGELLDFIEDSLGELKDQGINTAPIDRWIENFRGVPDVSEQTLIQYKKMLESETGIRQTGDVGTNLLDFLASTKLGARPVMLLRDMSNYVIMVGGIYGPKALRETSIVTAAKLRRIENLQARGLLPQTTSDAMLSRNARSSINTPWGKIETSKITDKLMRLSLQPQGYKVMLGNMYIHSYDSAMAAFTKAKGNRQVLIDELGSLLDSNPQAVQEYFLDMAQRDVNGAAEFLARSNAYNISNRFGRLNNPLAWQNGVVGRAMGQFGSWSLNAVSVLGESVANSRGMKRKMAKMTRLAGLTVATAAAAEAVGIEYDNWIVNPSGMVPTPGPMVKYWTSIGDASRNLFSRDAKKRKRARTELMNTGSDFITPTILYDMKRASDMWNEEADGYKTLMSASGFRMIKE